MEFLVEIAIQFVVEVVGEFLMEVGLRRSARALRSAIGRVIASSIAGFVFGVWWGSHLADQGGAHRPRLLWVSAALAVLAGAGALWRWRATKPEGTETRRSLSELVTPWNWTAYRLASLAVLNAAIAAGIATGWRPPVVG